MLYTTPCSVRQCSSRLPWAVRRLRDFRVQPGDERAAVGVDAFQHGRAHGLHARELDRAVSLWRGLRAAAFAHGVLTALESVKNADAISSTTSH